MSALVGKHIILGVCGSIAAYKAAEWLRALVKEEARVTVVMTAAAQQFVAPLTFSALSGNAVHVDMFDPGPESMMAHIDLSRQADALLIAPATAQTIARLSCGMADTLLASIALAGRIPVLVCPAMNSAMLSHPATQGHISRLEGFGYRVLQSGSGELACGEIGAGRLPEWDEAREALLALLTTQDLTGLRVVISAGPTREALDPVRYLSNRSSGKMGYALARVARRRGAQVTLVSGPVRLADPPGVRVLRVQSAAQMAQEVFVHAARADIIIKAAAVADFAPKSCAAHKIKKTDQGLQLELIKNPDILLKLGEQKRAGQVLVGFAAESERHEQEGLRKLAAKNLDLIVVNDILATDSGFDADTNRVLLLDRTGGKQALPLLSKEETAARIWDAVLALRPSANASMLHSKDREESCT